MTDPHERISPGVDAPGGGNFATRRPEGPPRPNLGPLYLALLAAAIFGLVAMKTAETMLERHEPPAPASNTEAVLTEMVAGFPWLEWAGVAFMVAGAVLLLTYAGLRLAGSRPVRQEPLNPVTWTLGALVKGLTVALFMMVVVTFIGGPLLFALRLPEGAIAAVITGTVEVLAVLWIIFMLRFEYGAKAADTGVTLRAPLRDVGYAFLTYLAIFPLVSLASIAWRWVGESLGLEYQLSPVISFLLETDSMPSIVLVSVSAVIIAPIAEEFFFRGFTYPALRRKLGVTPAVLVSSAYFALIHLDFFSFLPIMILGMALAFLYERRQNLVAPAALHFFNNARAVGLVLFLKFTAT